MKYWVFYFSVASVLDWWSTISYHDWRVEETPLIREIWRRYGDIGLTSIDILFFAITISIFIYGYKKSKFVGIAFGMLTTFKLLMALTNLALIPYRVLGWY
jgi:hypothetical protein